MPTAEIISIGTELLLGEIPDTNMQFIARELRNIGVSLFRTSIVGDNKHRVSELVNEVIQRADIIIITGGLGPTIDDPTREAVAIASGLPLVFHQELWDEIKGKFTQIGKVPRENQMGQAYLPTGAIPLQNPVGTAPGFTMYLNKCIVICLPGVPIEMETMLKISVIPFLKSSFNLKETIQVRILHTFGTGEGLIDESISDLEKLYNPTVGLAVKSGIVDIRIAARTESEEESYRLIDGVETEIRNRLGQIIFGVDDDTLQSVAINSALERNWKIISVENGTKGLMAKILAELNQSNIIGSFQFNDHPDQFLKYTGQKLIDSGADVALAINIITSDNSITLHQVLISPEDTYDKVRTLPLNYPAAIELGINLVLNRLRQIANRY